jgi:AcrR family transcriptional regulator
MGRPKNFDRDDVLERAMPLFWKRGFADTGLQDLEKATGVNKSGLYSEFKNKEDIFLATLMHYVKTSKGGEILSAEPLGWKNVENFFDYTLSNGKGCFAVNSMRELALLPQEAHAIMIKGRAFLKRMLAKNISVEKTKTSPETLAGILLILFSGLAIEQNLKAGRALPALKFKAFLRRIRDM